MTVSCCVKAWLWGAQLRLSRIYVSLIDNARHLAPAGAESPTHLQSSLQSCSTSPCCSLPLPVMRGVKRTRKDASPAHAWFEERIITGVHQWQCRHRGCTADAYTFKSPSTFASHMMREHRVDVKTMTPLTHPQLLREREAAAVFSQRIQSEAAFAAADMPAPFPFSLSSSSSSSSSSSAMEAAFPFSLSSASPLPAVIPASAFPFSLSSPNPLSTSILPRPSPISAASSVSSGSDSQPSSSSSLSLFSPAPQRSLRQQSLASSLQAQNNPLVAPAAAELYAKCGLSHRLADSKEMKAFLSAYRSATCPPPTRVQIKSAQAELAASLRDQVIAKLKDYSRTSPISLAIDGWTNTRHHKVTNLLCLCGGQAYYWCSIVNRYERNTAKWLLSPISKAIAELVNHGVRVVALVADNEAVNGKLHQLLVPTFPFLILSSCAAHTVQLCVNRALHVHGIREIMRTMEGVIRQFRQGKQSKALRLQLANLQRQAGGEASVRCLVIPCDTRWSSHRAAGNRLLQLHKFVDMCNLAEPPIDSFWLELKQLMDFLHPFQIATDVIQADNSTLYSVWLQFCTLLQYIDAVPSTSPFSPAMGSVHNIIVENWERHVNKPAAHCCAWFSFDDSVRQLSAPDLTAARIWFVNYAVIYAKQYKLLPEISDDILRGMIQAFWGQFTGRVVGTAFQDLDQLVASMKASQLATSRRLVDGEWCGTWHPASVWHTLLSEVPLFAHPVIAVLCVAGSEAAVERSFSAQDAVHTKKRNRLSDSSVQDEMYIRFNSDALRGIWPGEGRRVSGGHCVELTVDFDERPAVFSSVDSLFRMIDMERAAAAAAEAAAAAVDSNPAVVEQADMKRDGDSNSDASDSDYVSQAESSSVGESDSSVSNTQQLDEDEVRSVTPPLSRSASLAKQIELDSFITGIIRIKGWSAATNWKDRELENVIQIAAIKEGIKTTATLLKKMIKARAMESAE